MDNEITQEKLLIPVYINEKIVLDMLAIMENGFSTVSQVNYTEHKESENNESGGGGVSTSATIWSKLFKIDLSGEFSHTGRKGESENTVKEKVHTNVSLLSKFRTFLVKEKILKPDFDIKKISIGDFVEVEGELEKNPLIEYMDKFVDVFRMADIFSTEPELGNKTQAKQKKQQEQALLKQLESFAGELKHSGTVDFILSDNKGTIVLSAQEKYLSNDNISEILGGRFKVLGKVIAICKVILIYLEKPHCQFYQTISCPKCFQLSKMKIPNNLIYRHSILRFMVLLLLLFPLQYTHNTIYKFILTDT